MNPETLHNKKESAFSFMGEVVRFAVIAVIIVIPIRVYVAQPYIVSGNSMDPTFGNGDYLIIDELSYRFEKPERGDVVVFRFPQNPSQFFIKRIIGLPGETISLRSGVPVVVNASSPDGSPLSEPYVERKSDDNTTTTLGENEYFVMGDNRGASFDSRSWGALSGELVVGRALVRLLPLSSAAFFPGKYEPI